MKRGPPQWGCWRPPGGGRAGPPIILGMRRWYKRGSHILGLLPDRGGCSACLMAFYGCGLGHGMAVRARLAWKCPFACVQYGRCRSKSRSGRRRASSSGSRSQTSHILGLPPDRGGGFAGLMAFQGCGLGRGMQVHAPLV